MYLLYTYYLAMQQQTIIKTTKTNPPEDCRPCINRETGQCILANIIILVASNSLYHCTNLTILHSSLYLWVLCQNQLLCVISLSLVNTVQCCIILILVYKLV